MYSPCQKAFFFVCAFFWGEGLPSFGASLWKLVDVCSAKRCNRKPHESSDTDAFSVQQARGWGVSTHQAGPVLNEGESPSHVREQTEEKGG
jgi:hypothetical protein